MMPNELDPQVDQWYAHADKGQSFYVTAIDESEDTIEVQHFDGDVEEFTFDEWRALDIELSEEPENWTGALDIGERDDLGTEITDTTQRDWNEQQDELRAEIRERRAGESEEPAVDFDTGEAEEETGK
jgi:hypothetical protein